METVMSVYGLNATPGRIPFTGYTPTLGNGPANADATNGSVQFNGVTQGDFTIQQPLGLGGQVAGVLALLNALVGAGAGGTATKTKKQIQWQQGSPGGLIPIETITLVNRATTANDVTAFQALFNRLNGPVTYPADVSGNGGGGKMTAASGGAY